MQLNFVVKETIFGSFLRRTFMHFICLLPRHSYLISYQTAVVSLVYTSGRKGIWQNDDCEILSKVSKFSHELNKQVKRYKGRTYKKH